MLAQKREMFKQNMQAAAEAAAKELEAKQVCTAIKALEMESAERLNESQH